MSKKRSKHQYEFKIPERKAILDYLTNCNAPRQLSNIAMHFGLSRSEHRAALNKRLKAMLRDGQLIRNRRDGYIPVNEEDAD